MSLSRFFFAFALAALKIDFFPLLFIIQLSQAWFANKNVFSVLLDFSLYVLRMPQSFYCSFGPNERQQSTSSFTFFLSFAFCSEIVEFLYFTRRIAQFFLLSFILNRKISSAGYHHDKSFHQNCSSGFLWLSFFFFGFIVVERILFIQCSSAIAIRSYANRAWKKLQNGWKNSVFLPLMTSGSAYYIFFNGSTFTDQQSDE